MLAAAALLAATLTGCWSYRELDSLMIVSGLAIDKGEQDGQIMLTVEVVDVQNSSKNSANSSHVITMTGDSMFNIVRDFISVTGKRLYWSHAKIIILSKEITREGVNRYLDWFARDTETRADMFVLIADHGKAKDIFNPAIGKRRIISFEIADILKKEKNLERAPMVEIWDMINRIERTGKSPTAPLVRLVPFEKGWTEQVEGLAVLELGKYVGDLDGEQTLYCLFVKDLIRGGALVIDGKTMKNAISLEIDSSKTAKSLVFKNGKPVFLLRIKTEVSLDEVREEEPFYTRKERDELEARASKTLERRISEHIERVQSQYGADIFGFGNYIHEHHPELWKRYRSNWHEEFRKLDVRVAAEVNVKSTGKTSEPIKVVE
ncbi:Ger(x)C family spore germination protein [Gorillibacterium sp. sgz500922]|uniref:Ger(x)C family spore germination protein n=1 Tax=Gorillibacterium sp. sgz500922 TaxID=3446694 RepID=UPI003F673B84